MKTNLLLIAVACTALCACTTTTTTTTFPDGRITVIEHKGVDGPSVEAGASIAGILAQTYTIHNEK